MESSTIRDSRIATQSFDRCFVGEYLPGRCKPY
ncbi:Uncharacterised protein [Vibrio cholerae]|nr:Uncharacterised protein [Vibrio cholerae]